MRIGDQSTRRINIFCSVLSYMLKTATNEPSIVQDVSSISNIGTRTGSAQSERFDDDDKYVLKSAGRGSRAGSVCGARFLEVSAGLPGKSLGSRDGGKRSVREPDALALV